MTSSTPARPRVSVAIPVRDGAATLPGLLAAVRAQVLDGEVEVLACDSGSRDGSVALLRSHGVRVIEIARSAFGHGATRNLLMEHANGDHVALLTQDAQPADERWLSRLLACFERYERVGLAFGPYRPRPDADAQTARELERWFASLAPNGDARVDRLEPGERQLPALELFGRRTFFTDANACISREAWREVPFRVVAYAEDQALALDMLRAGYAKVFAPDAPVLHSHAYSSLERFRRAFDEWRALAEIYGWREPLDARRIALQLRGDLGSQWRDLSRENASRGLRRTTMSAAVRHHGLRLAGSLLGSRAEHLPVSVARWCSLEGRSSDPAADRAPDLPPADSR